MTESKRNIRTMTVASLACLACVFFGFLMGLSVSRPHVPARPRAESHSGVIRVADMVNATDFEDISAALMSLPEVNHHTIQGTPLKMLKIKLVNAVREGITKHEFSLLEKGMLNVTEAVFSDFTNAPEEYVERFKTELLPLLDFRTSDGASDPDLNCTFGLTEDGGKTMSSFVIVMSYSNLQIIRLNGQIDPAVMDILAGL